MADATPTEPVAPSSPKPVESIEVDDAVKQEDAGDDGSDHDDVAALEDGQDEPAVSTEQYKALKNMTEILTTFKPEGKAHEGHHPSDLFKRIPNKRNLPGYYEIIKEPSAISTLKGKIQRKQYTGIPEFVRDFALIVHNAQVFNRPNSQPIKDVFQLEATFKAEIQKLVDQGLIKAEETVFPDLGEIPDATPEPDPASEEDDDDEAEDDGEEDDEDDEGDDSDDDRRKRRGRRGGRTSVSNRKQGREEDDETGKNNEADIRKRRGRPPKVDTPMEARIKAILKGIRKPKDQNGNLKILPFERLPDKAEHPHYFQEIKEPMALDMIKKKAKRKKYQSLEHFMKDVELMFKNAMAYNEDSSDLFKAAKELNEEAQKLTEAEKAKPDKEYLMEDGRVPLPGGILYKNELWKVGDWIHIQNPNDVTKPIVAQIYRTWQDSDGQKWINACWYYRPEQTVHQYEKHFYPNEVVKTGQYRDHQIEEVMDRCFVMFFTRYNRGRPRNFDSTKEVYVCEARYNEEKHKFNKIKTWASCLPDEVRDKDYEMDLFDTPRKIKKVPSPIKNLLKDDAKETDGLPSPQWGNANAPPIVGAVHKQPRDENQSPPPEPTPPPPPTPPPQPARAPPSTLLPYQQPRPSYDRQASSGLGTQNQITRPSPSMTPQLPTYQAASPVPQHGRQTPYQQPSVSNAYASATPQTPAQPPVNPFLAQQQLHPPPSLSAAHPTSYTGATPSQGYGRPQIPPAPTTQFTSYPTANVHEARAREVYVLSDTANQSIPKEIRDRFPQDDHGRVLFFTKPPVDTRHVITGRSDAERGRPLAHTEKYLVAKAERDEQRKRRAEESAQAKDYKRAKAGAFDEERDADGRIRADPLKAAQIRAEYEKREQEMRSKQQDEVILPMLCKGIDILTKQVERGHINEYIARYGSSWKEYMDEDDRRHSQRAPKEASQAALNAESRKKISNEPLYDNDWAKKSNHWTGYFKDDYDARLPPY